ncbi:response regulator [Hymenobacter glacieicola]|uniref:Response regulator n=1 Tax=Hymenobacter glacieicola TaxID=1562124 RepID=A0ABQ1WRC6_9BACT|nr:response regulator [Hymenobacter glacieicola]GGG43050.1 response regulator [Hymenobacter glacieicola]
MDKLSCILLVDDDKTTNFLNRLLLENLGVADRVLVAENGREALRLIEQNSTEETCPALILLDINMPVMNGFDFLDAYQDLSFDHKQSVVIVMLTTSLNPRDVARLQQLPTNGFMNKPLTKKMVHDVLKEHFNLEFPA